MNQIGTFGLFAYLIASKTMPIGFPIKAFADDADSIQVHEAENGQAILDLNGKVIRWTVANPLVISIAVMPNTVEDDILAVIYNANRVSKTSKSVNDSINLMVKYPNGGIRTFVQGRIVAGPSAYTATAEGRMVGNIYTFAFGDQYALTVAAVLNTIAGQLGIGDKISSITGL